MEENTTKGYRIACSALRSIGPGSNIFIEELKDLSLFVKSEDIVHNIGVSERTGAVIEPKFSHQWFLKMEDISNTYSETSPVVDSDPDDLIVNLDGFEGPLDVLLTLAKSQKVNLTIFRGTFRLTHNHARVVTLSLTSNHLQSAWLA